MREVGARRGVGGDAGGVQREREREKERERERERNDQQVLLGTIPSPLLGSY